MNNQSPPSSPLSSLDDDHPREGSVDPTGTPPTMNHDLPMTPPSSPETTVHPLGGNNPHHPPTSPSSAYSYSHVSQSVDVTPSATRTPMTMSMSHFPNSAHPPHSNMSFQSLDALAGASSGRSRLPRGDLGMTDLRLNQFSANLIPNQTGASGASGPSGASGHHPHLRTSPTSSTHSSRSQRMHDDTTLPALPFSPPSSPGSVSSIGTALLGNHLNYNLDDDRSPASEPQPHSQMQQHEEQFDNAIVWGTNVSIRTTMHVFRQFLNEFRATSETTTTDDNDEEEGYYLRVIDQMHLTQEYILNLDCQHLLQYRATRKLYEQLIHFPQVLIKLFDMVIGEEYQARHANLPEDFRIQVRAFNLRDIQPMRDLNPSDIDQLVCVKGMVIRASAVIPDLKEAFFRCSVCQFTISVALDRGKIDEPTTCGNDRCSERMTMVLIHNRCSFTDKQMVKMQETPDCIPEGETPHTITLFAFDDLVDAIRPGDKVEVTGIFRAIPLRTNPRKREVKSVFKTYLDIIHYHVMDGGVGDTRAVGVGQTGENEQQEEEEEEDDGNHVEAIRARQIAAFRDVASDPQVYEKLAASLAPSIWELDDVKKGVLCQLFGGCDKRPPAGSDKSSSSSGNNFRSDINVLLCGDPGTSKSQLLSYVHKIAPRGIYTSGKGSSAVGLTASVVRDQETGDNVLESGALVLSDQGICCIDEFDKMSDSARAVLHEVMEQQTVSIAKAGIICSLNARTSILASANPIDSRYNPNKSVTENIDILPTLLSRFDLIYLVIDHANVEKDRRLAKHIVALYFEQPTARPPPISMKFLSEYVAYAKANVHPKLSPAACEDLIQGYLDLRSLGHSRKCITATPRQLESLIRLAEAHARIRFGSVVERRDVSEALRLMNVATQRAALDPRTGTIDMDMLTTGHTLLGRQALGELTQRVKDVLTQWKGRRVVTLAELRQALGEELSAKTKTEDLEDALRSLEEDKVIQYSQSTIKIIGDLS